MADKSVKLLFEVARGGAAGDSAATIKSQLAEIMNEINGNSNLTSIRVRFNTSSLRAMKTQLRDELSNITFTPSRQSIQTMRQEIQRRLQEIPVNVKLGDVTTKSGSGSGSSRSSSGSKKTDPLLKSEAAELDRIVKAYEKAQKAFDTALFKGAGSNKMQALSDIAAQYEKQFNEALTRVRARTDQTWQDAADTAVKKMEDAKQRISTASTVASAELLDKANANLANAFKDLSSFDTNKVNVNGLSEEYNRLSEAVNNLSTNANPDNINAYYEALRKWGDALSQVKRDMPVAVAEVEKLQNALRAEINTSNKYSPEQIQALTDAFNSLNGEVSRSTFKDAEKTLKDVSKAADAGAKKVTTFGIALKSAFYMFSTPALITRGVQLIIRSFREMISTVIELDDAITQMQIVTRGSEQDMMLFAASITQTAKRIGASTADLIDSATTYARLGYDTMESSLLAEYTSMLSNVGDIDVSEAQDAVTSIIKGFQLDAGEIGDIVQDLMDKMVIVGNNFPISVSQLAEGMNNAGSMLAMAGNSFEKAAALMTAANTSVQNVSKSSTGLRTIAARLRKTTTELDELGETITTAQHERLLKLLTDNKVAIIDAVTGEFRDTYDIIEDLAANWGSISSVNQSAIMELMAGTRQQNVLASLITNFREAQDAMDAMTHSAGALESAYEDYSDSITAHLQTFKSAFGELGQNLIDTGLITDLVDFGTNIIEVLSRIAPLINDIITALGGARGVLRTITTILSVSLLNKYATGIGSISKGLTGAAKAGEAAAKAGKGFMSTWTTAGKVAGVLGAAYVTVMAISEHFNRIAADQAEMRQRDIEDTKNELRSLQEISNKYSSMFSDGEFDVKDRERALELQTQIEELTKDHGDTIQQLVDKLDLENGKYEEQLDLILKIKAAEAGRVEDDVVYEADEAYERYRSGDATASRNSFMFMGTNRLNPFNYAAESIYQQQLFKLFERMGKLDVLGYSGGYREFTSQQRTAQDLADLYAAANQYMTSNRDWYETADAMFGTSARAMRTLTSTYAQETKTEMDAIHNAMLDAVDIALDEAIPEIVGSAENVSSLEDYTQVRATAIKNLLDSERFDEWKKSGAITQQDVYDIVDNALAEAFPAYAEEYAAKSNPQENPTQTKKFIDVDDVVGNKEITQRYTELEQSMDDLISKYNALQDGEKLSLDDLNNLLAAYPELAKYVDYTAEGYGNLAEGMKEVIESEPDSFIQYLQDEFLSQDITDEARQQVEAIMAMAKQLGTIASEDIAERLGRMVTSITTATSTAVSAIGEVTGISSEQFGQLVAMNDDFADAIEFNGMAMSLNAEKAGKILTDMAEDYIVEIDKEIAANMESIQALELKERQLGSLTNAEYKELDALRQSVQQYRVMRGEILETISSYQKWINAQGTSNEDAMFNEVEKAYQHLQNVFQNSDSDIFGQWNTDDTLAALELWAGQIDDFMTNGVLDFGRVQKFIDEVGVYMKDGMQGMSTFIDDLVQKGFGSIQDGQFELYDGVLLRDISDAFGIGTDTLTSFFKRLNTYGFDFHFEDEEFERLKNDADSAAEAVRAIYEDQGEALDATSNQEVFDKAIQDGNSSLQRRIELSRQLTDAQTWMDEYGGSMDPEVVQNQTALIEQLRSELDALPPVKQVEIDLLTAAYSGKIAELQAEKELQLQVNADFDTTAIDSEIAEYETRIGELQAVVDVANVEETNSKLEAVRSVAEQIAMILDEDYNLTIRTSSAYANLRNVSTVLSTIIGQIQTINRTSINIAGSSNVASSVAAATSSVSNVFNKLFGKGKVSGSGVAMAKGSYDAGGGDTLVGELGRELYVDPATNTWQTVGDNGAEFVKLPKHAIVFSHKQTESLLGTGRINGRGTAMVSGNAKVGGGGNIDLFRKFAAAAAASAYANSGSGSGSGSDSSSSGSEKSAFEKLYDYHKHLIAMDQESMEDFLNWLAGAYQQAYNAGEIELDDFYRY